jgi:hypothetical protein
VGVDGANAILWSDLAAIHRRFCLLAWAEISGSSGQTMRLPANAGDLNLTLILFSELFFISKN